MDGSKELKSLINLSYEDFVKKLQDLANDPKIQAAIIAGRKDGLKDDEKISFEEIDIDVNILKPTQKEIDLESSLYFPLSGETGNESLGKMISGSPCMANGTPVVTLNGEYIIDGHHRWSQIYCMNKDAKIKCLNMITDKKVDPMDILKAVQLAIVSVTKEIPSEKSSGLNIYYVKEDFTKNYLLTGEGAERKKNFKGINPDVFSFFKKMVNDIESKNDLADFIWNNIVSLRKTSSPVSSAPSRDYMPQPDGTNELSKALRNKLKDSWKDDLLTGKINFLPPFKTVAEMKIKNFNDFINENYSNFYTYKEIIDYIKEISDTPETDIPDYYLDLIAKDKPKFIKKIVNFEDLFKNDKSYEEYVKSGEDRYEDSDYEPHWEELEQPIVIFKGEVIDGYNRSGAKWRNGDKEIEAYISVD
jgi:hypothetical protein